MGERFASVWDALPADLRDADGTVPMWTECRRLSAHLGFTLVLRADWWHLTATGIRCRFGDVADCREWLRNRARTAREPFFSASGTVDLGLPENALQAVWLALPIGSNDWTDETEDATHAGCMNACEVSNE